MSELYTNINWLAVIISSIAAFVLGAIWYSQALFAKGWAEGSRIDVNSKPDGWVLVMVTQFIGTFLLAWLIAVVCASDLHSAAYLAVLTVAVLIYAGGGYNQKTIYAKAVESGYVIAMGVVIILIQKLF